MRLKSMFVKVATVAAGLASVVVIGSAAPASADYVGTMSVSTTSGPPGTVISMTSQSGCPGGTSIEAHLVELSTQHSWDSNSEFLTFAGTWSTSLTVPPFAPPGAYKVTVACVTPFEEPRTVYGLYQAPFTVTSPGFDLSAPSIAFGNGQIGATIKKSVVITNSGTANLRISDVTVEGVSAAEFSADACVGRVILPGGTCKATVTWKPKAHASVNASLIIADNTAAGTHAVALYGRGCYVAVGTVCL